MKLGKWILHEPKPADVHSTDVLVHNFIIMCATRSVEYADTIIILHRREAGFIKVRLNLIDVHFY